MVASPRARCAGIAVLLVGLFGLLVLGGGGWSIAGPETDASSGSNEIVVFEKTDFDLGADYRDAGVGSVADGDASERVTTAGLASVSGLADALIGPADRDKDVRIGGLPYAIAISLVGAGLVVFRGFVGWRLDIRGVALEPRVRLPFVGRFGGRTDRAARSRGTPRYQRGE